ncbi:MAG: carboxypeptidase-like regulatory domain-containing protein, partial [Ferruginibacter sp.]
EIKRNELTNEIVKNAESIKKTEAVVRKFGAQVVGPDGNPLPFANISITNEKAGTYADAKGNFRLLSSDSLLNIEIKSTGYISGNFNLRSDIPQNKIVLAEEELSLNENIQVTGKGTASKKKRKAVLESDSVINAEPADGWNNYNTYITNNLSFSDEILEKRIHGEVEVSFEVQSNGLITNLKIEKPLCNDCDEEAMRVIKDGPRWKVIKGNKAIARIKVKF